MGFRNMLLGYRDADRGHIIENIVFLELLRRDYRVYIGKIGEAEIDFIAEKPDDKLYIQVTESMQSPETRERELRPLRMIQDNYEKNSSVYGQRFYKILRRNQISKCHRLATVVSTKKDFPTHQCLSGKVLLYL